MSGIYIRDGDNVLNPNPNKDNIWVMIRPAVSGYGMSELN